MKHVLLTLLIFSSALGVSAQKYVDWNDEPSFFERLYVGGGLGFSTDQNATFISVSPIVGYMITSNLSAGVGVDYQYIRYRFADITDNIYGGSAFVRYNISQFFLQTEYSVLNIESSPFDDVANRRNYDRFLFGGGISQPLGRNSRVNVIGLYDFMYNELSPFASPWVFRVFISG